MEINGTIYKIKNLVNGKVYIGQTIQLYENYIRWIHINRLNSNKHKNRHLQNAWDKYGSGSFEFSVLYENVSSYDLLDFHEHCMIEYFKDGDNLYNMKSGGNSTRYSRKDIEFRINSGKYKKTEKWKHMMSNKCKGRDMSKLISIAADLHRGTPLTDKHKRKLSESLQKSYRVTNSLVNHDVVIKGKSNVIEYIKNFNTQNKFTKRDKINGDILFRAGQHKHFKLKRL